MFGCAEKVEIEQEVKVDSRINCTYLVCTFLWDRYPTPSDPVGTIEESFCDFNIPASKVEEIKAEQMAKIQPYYERFVAAIKNACEKPK